MTNTGEVMTEMAKTQSGVQHRHTPDHGKHPTRIPCQNKMNHPHQQAGQADGQAPSGPSMALVTGV